MVRIRPSPQWLAFLERLPLPPMFSLALLAILVGVGTGYLAVLFIWGLHWVARTALRLGTVLGWPGLFLALLVGGGLTALLVTYVAQEAKGHGVPEIMTALLVHRGRIRPQVVVVKVVSSMLTIGVGGSAGREGPIAQAGAALGSTVGQWFRVTEERLKVLVAAGAAGGIAATFNAPIAGSIFALEVILGELQLAYFGVVVIAAVAASIISRMYLGEAPAFHVPAYGLNSAWELPFYLILGLLCAGLAVLFIRMLYGLEDRFDAAPLPSVVKPVLGLLATGGVALVYPEVLGPGLEFTGDMIAANVDEPVLWLLGLALAKLVATSFTLGGGNSGGVFAPSLFSGAALGGAFGLLLEDWLPGLEINPGAYALVGMAATFSAAARAPLTSILIVFEMSGDYRLILPLMFATVVSTMAAHYLHPESIYTLKLAKRGLSWHYGRDRDLMEQITVREAMDPHPSTVPDWFPVRMLMEAFTEAHAHGFPVLNAQGEMVGIVTLSDYQRALKRPDFDQLKVADIMTREVIVAYPDESLWEALRRMGIYNVGRMPVVSRQNPRRLLGIIRGQDVIRAYNLALARREAEKQREAELSTAAVTPELSFERVTLQNGAWAAHKRIRELALPEACILVAVQRGRRWWVPHGNTLLLPGDVVTVCAPPAIQAQVARLLLQGPEEKQAPKKQPPAPTAG